MADAYKGLTVKLGADTSKLTDALKKARSSMSGVSSELRRIERGLKLDPGNVRLLTQQQTELRRAINGTADELRILKQTEQDVLSGAQKLDDTAWRNLQYDIALAEKRLEGYNARLKESVIQQAASESALGRFGSTLQSVGGKLDSAGQKVASTGDAMSRTVTVGILAAGAATIKAATDIDTSLTSVKKTVDGTEEQYQELKEAAIEFSQTNAVSPSQILDIQALGAQLGFTIDELDEFSEVVSGLDIATNMDADTAATEMARFANITKMSHGEISNYGSAIVGLGNSFATTESDISAMAMRLAAAGTQVGMSQADILGLATALSSMGVEAEAGGTAISTVMAQIDKDIATNADSVETWASTAGMSAQAFADAWRADPVDALASLFSNMERATAEGGNMSVMLEELGIDAVRQTDIMKRLAGNSELVGDAVATANTEWEKNSALQREVDNRNESLASKFEILKNRVTATAEDVGGPLAYAMLDAVDAAEPLIQAIAEGAQSFADMSKEEQQTVIQCVALLAAAGPMLSVFGRGMQQVKNFGTACSSLATFLAKMGGAAKDVGPAMDNAAKKTDNATTATKKHTDAMKLSSVAMGALKTLAAGAFLAAITIIGTALKEAHDRQVEFKEATEGLRDAVTSGADAASSSASAFGEYGTSAGSAAASVDDLISKQAQLAGSIRERNEETANSVAIMGQYGDAISDLAGRSDLSAEEVARLQIAVDGVNDSCGTSYTVAQDAGGAYQVMSEGAVVAADAIENLIEKQMLQAQVDVASENYADALRAQAEAADAVAAATEKAAQKQAELDEAMESGIPNITGFVAARDDANKELEEANALYDAATQAMSAEEQQMTLCTMAMADNATAATQMVANNQQVVSTLQNAGFNAVTFAQQLDGVGLSQEQLAALTPEQLLTISQAYDGTTGSIIGSLQGMADQSGNLGYQAIDNWRARFSEGTQAAIDAAILATGMTEAEFISAAEQAGASGEEGVAAFANHIAAGAPFAGTSAKSVANAAEDPLRASIAKAGQDGSQAGGQYASGIGGKEGATRSSAQSLSTAAGSMKVSGSYGWGAEVGSNFASGILSAVGQVAAAAGALASAAASQIRHSVPKEGPLRNGGKGEKEWGEHTVQNYIDGINAKIPEVRKAMAQVTGHVADGMDAAADLTMGLSAVKTRSAQPVSVVVSAPDNALTKDDVRDAFMSAVSAIPDKNINLYIGKEHITDVVFKEIGRRTAGYVE